MNTLLGLYRTSIIVIQRCRHAKNYNTCAGILLNIRVVISQCLLSIAVLATIQTFTDNNNNIILILRIRVVGRRDYNVTYKHCDGYGARDEWSYYIIYITVRERNTN